MQRDLFTWEDFKREMGSATRNRRDSNLVYRGQAEAGWSVVSSFDRECPASVRDRVSYFKTLLDFFSYQLRQYGEDLDGLKEADRAAIAQHYGMPTRLIDWSQSPYIAAFMAFFSAVSERRGGLGKRVAIWSLDLARFKELVVGEDPQFKIVKTRRIENDRVWRQSGLFIEAVGAAQNLDAYLESRASGSPETGLTKWTLPTGEAVKALNDLILMGLTPATVYPDRDGAAKYVRLRMALDRL